MSIAISDRLLEPTAPVFIHEHVEDDPRLALLPAASLDRVAFLASAALRRPVLFSRDLRAGVIFRGACCTVGAIDPSTAPVVAGTHDFAGFTRARDVLIPGAGGNPLVLRVELPEPHRWSVEETGALQAIADGIAAEVSLRVSLRRYEEFIARDALDGTRDALTALPTQPVAMERIEAAVRCASRRPEFRFAVMHLAIDNLEVMSKALGARAGDEIVRSVADRLRRSVRVEDALAVAGRGEFVLLIEHLSADLDATRVAMRIQDRMQAPVTTCDGEIAATLSIGIMLSTGGLDAAARLVERAGVAAARSRELSPGGYQIFDTALQESVRRRLASEADLRRGLNQGEFEPFYQPIVSLETGRIIAAEALLRWRNPRRGIVVAGEFIPLAAECGLLPQLGWLSIAAAIPQIGEWRDRLRTARNLRLSLNVSAAQLREAGFGDRLARLIAAAGVDPRSLILEITESELIDDLATAKRTFSALRDLGVSIHLDDFGAGFSSLRYLRELPVDGIKLDREFLKDVMDRGAGVQLLRTVRQLATDVGAMLIAEGVETEAHFALARSLAYDAGQGYHFGRAVTSNEMEQMIAADEALVAMPAVATR